mgnify:CR=1 FL=1|tara:strand:+ start:1450 stop:2427 length:978 start_codon:yes stop_codon:yes gene_type:complete
MQEREQFPDLLRGVGIFTVVYIHSISLTHQHVIINYFSSIMPWEVGAFIFFFSLFYFKKLNKKSFPLIDQAQTFKRLLIPFFFWSSVYFILTVDLKSVTALSIITKHFSGFGWPGQYFFIILLQLVVVIPLLAKANFSVTIFLFVTSLFLGSFFNILTPYVPLMEKLSQRPFIYWLPFVLMALHSEKLPYFRRKEISLIALIFCIAIIPIEVAHLKRNANLNINHHLTFSIYLITITIILSREHIIKILQRIDILKRLLMYLGRNTMAIFCINPLIILILKKTNIFPLGIMPSFIELPILTFVVMSMCLLTAIIFKSVGGRRLVA